MTTLSGETLTVYRAALRILRERGDAVTMQTMEACADLAVALSRSPVDWDEAERLADVLELELDEVMEEV